jgi:hypothetical protein
MEKKPIEVECVIDVRMTVILPMDGAVLEEEFGGDYGALRDDLIGNFKKSLADTAVPLGMNIHVDGVKSKVFVKDEIGGGEE